MLPVLPPAIAEEVRPAPPLELDLTGALGRARQENALLRAARAQVEERRGLITTVRADAFTQLTLVGDFTRTKDVTFQNAGLGELFKAIIPPSVPFDPARISDPRSVYTTQITASQPLYHWGKIGTAVEIAKMGEKEARHAFTSTELDILHGVAKAYLAVLSAQAELEVVESRKRTAAQFLADVKAKLEAQTATELDRLRAESEFLGVLPESLQAEANLKRALEVLNGQLGLDPRTPLKLAELGLPETTSLSAVAERAEIARYKQQEAMLKSNDTILKSDLRPKFDLGAAYGWQAVETKNLFKEPFETWRVNVTMRFPFFDGLRSSGKRAQNRAQLEQVRQLRIDKERAVAVEQRSSERELEKALAFHEAAKKAHDAGLEALRMSRESFEQGLITSLDLLQAERMERQLESQRRRADLALWAARFDQRRALGLPPL